MFQHHHTQGFSLLEVLLALVIISSTGMALYSLINSQFTSLRLVASKHTEQQLKQQLVTFSQTLNPLLTPNGQSQVGSYRFHWHSQAHHLSSPTLNQLNPNFLVGLYNVEINLVTPQGQQLQIKRILPGYQQLK